MQLKLKVIHTDNISGYCLKQPDEMYRGCADARFALLLPKSNRMKIVYDHTKEKVGETISFSIFFIHFRCQMLR